MSLTTVALASLAHIKDLNPDGEPRRVLTEWRRQYESELVVFYPLGTMRHPTTEELSTLVNTHLSSAYLEDLKFVTKLSEPQDRAGVGVSPSQDLPERLSLAQQQFLVWCVVQGMQDTHRQAQVSLHPFLRPHSIALDRSRYLLRRAPIDAILAKTPLDPALDVEALGRVLEVLAPDTGLHQACLLPDPAARPSLQDLGASFAVPEPAEIVEALRGEGDGTRAEYLVLHLSHAMAPRDDAKGDYVRTTAVGVSGLQVLMALVSRPPHAVSETFLPSLLHALMVLLRSGPVRACFTSSHLETITSLVSTHAARPDLLAAAAALLVNAAYMNEAGKTHIVASGVLGRLVGCMAVFEHHEGLSLSVLRLLRNTCNRQSAAKQVAMESGALRLAVQALRRFPNNMDMLRQGVYALRNMAERDATVCNRLDILRAPRHVARILRSFSDPDLVRACNELLGFMGLRMSGAQIQSTFSDAIEDLCGWNSVL